MSKPSAEHTYAAHDLAAWASAGESEVLEFKATTGQKGQAAKALCGMLNGDGGRVVFGVSPTGELIGQHVTDKTVEDVVATFKAIQPDIQPRVHRVPIAPGKEAIVATVASGSFKPYLYKGTAYRRVGATTQEMTWDEQQRMLMEQAHTPHRWELELSPFGFEDLDLDMLNAAISDGITSRRIDKSFPQGRDPQQLLLGLGLLRGGAITHAAAVLFGKSAALEFEYPQCVAKLAVFEGTTVTNLIEVKQIRGNAFELIEATERFVHDRTRIMSKLRPDELRRQDTPEIPVLALREAIANAVAHREYHTAAGSISAKIFDDRVEITSIGTLHFGLTPDQLTKHHEAHPWNPNIAGMLYRRGIVETLGTGTLRMAEHARDAGLAVPTITADKQVVRVTFSRYGYVPVQLQHLGLTPDHARILNAIRENEPIARSALIERTGLRERSIRTMLDHLRDRGLADYSGQRTTALWHLAGKARTTYGLNKLTE